MDSTSSQLIFDEAQAVAGIEQPTLLHDGSAKIKVLTGEIEAAVDRSDIPVVIVDELERRRNRLWRALEQAARDDPVEDRRQWKQRRQTERERERQFQQMVL